MSSGIVTSFRYSLVCWFLLLSSSGLSQNQFKIDNTHTSCIFSVSHFDISYIYGRFNQVEGLINIDKSNPDQCTFVFDVVASSIDTNDDGRDKHLKSGEFFDVENFPKIEFRSKSVALENGIYQASGSLKLLGVEKEVTIPMQILGVGKGPFGKTRMGLLGKFTIKRSDFGMDKMLDAIGDTVAITISLQGIRQLSDDGQGTGQE